MTQEQRKRIESALEKLKAGQQYTFAADEGHVILVMVTNETGVHSGRPRYLVVCTTCETLLHEATTGVCERTDQHCWQHEQRTV